MIKIKKIKHKKLFLSNTIISNNNMNKKIIEEYNDNTFSKKLYKNRSTKKELYRKERENIIKKMNKILCIDETKNYVYLYDIENNEIIKNRINELSEEIRKYFKVGNWNYYIMKNNSEKPQEIGLIRAVYRDEDIIMTKKESKNNSVHNRKLLVSLVTL